MSPRRVVGIGALLFVVAFAFVIVLGL